MFTKGSTGFNLVILFLMLVATSATVYEVQHQQTAVQQAASSNTCNKIPGQYCSAQICTNLGNVAGLGRCPATLSYCCKIAPTSVPTPEPTEAACSTSASCYPQSLQSCSIGYNACLNASGTHMCCLQKAVPH